MGNSRPQQLHEAIDHLYETFKDRRPGKEFCSFCWNSDEISQINTPHIREIPAEITRKLLWEAHDHFESIEVFQYYLPRILHVLAPPALVEDLYPSHLSETLQNLAFEQWPDAERNAVLDFLDLVTPELVFFDEVERREWEKGISELRQDKKKNSPIE